MITRFYVDNYKCLVNFEYKPQPFELIIGANGSGKSTVFEALDKVRQFVAGEADARELFARHSKTAWSFNTTQIFEVDFMSGSIPFRYRLEIDLSSDSFRVEKEAIQREGQTVVESEWRKVRGWKHDDEHSSDAYAEAHRGELRFFTWQEEGLEFPLSSPNQSMMNAFPMLSYGSELSSILLCKLNPPLMISNLGSIEERLDVNGANFASYYSYVLQQKQSEMFEVISQLREIFPGFESFGASSSDQQGRRKLVVNFSKPAGVVSRINKLIPIPFDDLSDGQRALIVLYTLLFCALDADSTLVIDEPENYIALRELQPLILLMEERLEEIGGQILLISHNQEFINMLTDRDRCIRFYRENNGHTRIAAFNPDSELTAAEIVARGWEDDEQ